jgi:hypothetical protein
MRKQQDQQILTKDDSDLFELVKRLADDRPPYKAFDQTSEAEAVVQIELPFSTLVQAVDQLSVDNANLLYRRLEDRLVKAGVAL